MHVRLAVFFLSFCKERVFKPFQLDNKYFFVKMTNPAITMDKKLSKGNLMWNGLSMSQPLSFGDHRTIQG